VRPASLRASRGKGSARTGKALKVMLAAPGGGRTRTHKEAKALERGNGSPGRGKL